MNTAGRPPGGAPGRARLLLRLSGAFMLIMATEAAAIDPSLPVTSAPSLRMSSGAVSIAKRYLGGNPTRRSRLWCAAFMNMVEQKAGRRGTGSDAARSYLSYGQRVSRPRPGDIVVLWRGGPNGRSGHVGYFLADEGSHIRIISGNHNRKVGIGTYPKSRVLGYRRP